MQKTQVMMSSRTVMESLAVMHKKGARGRRGPWEELFIRGRGWGTDAAGGVEGDCRGRRCRLLCQREYVSQVWANARKVFAFHFLKFLECHRVHIQLEFGMSNPIRAFRTDWDTQWQIEKLEKRVIFDSPEMEIRQEWQCCARQLRYSDSRLSGQVRENKEHQNQDVKSNGNDNDVAEHVSII